MIDIANLKRGQVIVSLIDIPGMLISKGDHLTVVETGFSRWDRAVYADVQTIYGYKLEIMHNYRDFEPIS